MKTELLTLQATLPEASTRAPVKQIANNFKCQVTFYVIAGFTGVEF